MSKILLLGDVHLSDRPPSSCTETYLDDMFDLLYQTAEIANEGGYVAAVQAGDLFHSKMPVRTSHRTIQRVIEWVQHFSCPFFIVPGNHDLAMDRLDSVMDGQPLGVILRSGAHMLQGWADIASAGNQLSFPLYGVPWLQSWNDKDLEGEPSDYVRSEAAKALEDWNSRYDGSVPALLVTHAPFYPPGLELEFEYFPTKMFADLMGNKGSVYYGHVHEPAGTFVANGVRFCNNGALSRGSLHEYNLSREIVATEWDSVTSMFTAIPLDCKPASEVFKLTEIEAQKTAQVDLDAFLTSIGETTIEITSIEAVMVHIRNLNLGTASERLIEELLEGAKNA